MKTSRFATVIAALGVSLFGNAARAQSVDTAARSKTIATDPRDTLFLRARRLVTEGNGAAGRALVDSAMAATAGSADYATALYWHGALSSTAADAERDYRRVIVEYPFSAHAGDALLALAQLEMARGDRAPAIDHLQRFLLQHPNDPDRVRAGIWLGRMLLDQNQLAKGCAVLVRTRSALGDTSVEVRNQVDYYAARCVGVDTTSPAPRGEAPVATAKVPRSDSGAQRRPPIARDSARADTSTRRAHADTARRPAVRRDTARPDSARHAAPRRESAKAPTRPTKPPAPSEGTSTSKRFTVQVAAYDTKEAADQLVAKLGARGIVARVVDIKSAPYRVRIGRYATDADAAAAARDLKEKGIVGFVTTTDNESAAAPVRR
jgi:cell division septation protein DedD